MKRDQIEQLLPGVFQRTVAPGSVLAALLEVMEELHAPAEDVLEGLHRFFDPYQAPDTFIAYLSGWVDLDHLLVETRADASGAPAPRLPSGTGRLRDLVTRAAYLSRWRGTARGLVAFLEMATGEQGFAVDERVPAPDGRERAFHIRVRAPATCVRYRALLDRIIMVEKPAYVTYDLMFEAEDSSASR